MRKKYNTPHRSRVVKTRLSEDEYADFTARLAPYGISQSEFLRQAIRRTTIGVPGVVVVGNSLFPDAERAPTDFWFTHKYFALDEKAFENAYQQTKE